MREKRNAHWLLLRKPARKRPLRRPRNIWVKTIKVDLETIGWARIDWVHMDQNRDQW
jgi:hypothetical protein